MLLQESELDVGGKGCTRFVVAASQSWKNCEEPFYLCKRRKRRLGKLVVHDPIAEAAQASPVTLTSGSADAEHHPSRPKKGAGSHLVSSSGSGPALRRFPLPHKELLPDARCCGEKSDQKKSLAFPTQAQTPGGLVAPSVAYNHRRATCPVLRLRARCTQPLCGDLGYPQLLPTGCCHQLKK